MNRNGFTFIYSSRLKLPAEEGGMWFSDIETIRKECRPFLFWDETDRLVHPDLTHTGGVFKGRMLGLIPFTFRSVRWEMILHDHLDIRILHHDFQTHRKVDIRDQVAWVKDIVYLHPKSHIRLWTWTLFAMPLFWLRHTKLRNRFNGESYIPEWERNYF